MSQKEISLDKQWMEFKQRPFVTMPIAGAIAWAGIGICGMVFDSTFAKCMSIFVGTGMIFYLALFLTKFTGEDLLGKNRPRNLFDRVFLLTVLQAVGVYSVAIPFFLENPESLPMTVGILTGLMWLPFSGMLEHWVGLFHSSVRTAACVTIWYAFPEHRFTAIPLAIVIVYLVTLFALAKRETTPAPLTTATQTNED